MDLLDRYEANALAHPREKKQAGQVRSRIQAIQNKINITLYGKTSTEKARNFFDVFSKERLEKLNNV